MNIKRPILYPMFERYCNTLWNNYIETKNLESTEIKGEAREILVEKFLRKILPPKLEVETCGEIIDSKGGRSRQIDILVIRNDCPFVPLSISEKGKRMLYFIEGVFAVIEVKSMLNKSELEDAINKLESVRNLKISGGFWSIGSGLMIPRPLRIIFAYESISLERIREIIVNNHKEDIVDVISVLSKGAIIKNAKYFEPKEGGLIKSESIKNSLLIVSGKLASLAMLYLYIVQYATSFIGRTLNLIPYFEPINGWID